jgi:hypothetical protein
MHVVRMESLEKLETEGTQMWLSANAGLLSIVFPLSGPWPQGDNFCRS